MLFQSRYNQPLLVSELFLQSRADNTLPYLLPVGRYIPSNRHLQKDYEQTVLAV